MPINTRSLLLGATRMAGARALGAGCALAAMLAVPFRRGEPWAHWTIFAVLFITQPAGLQTSAEVAAKTGAHTPWPLSVAGLCMTLVGAVLCALTRRRKA